MCASLNQNPSIPNACFRSFPKTTTRILWCTTISIHLNARNTQLPHNYKGHISCSCLNTDELKERVRSFDYVFLSSLFDATREDGFGEQFSVQKLNEMADNKLIGRKVMAFGNVDIDNMPLVKSLGFGGAVILGDLWNRFNIHTNRDYKEMITHFRKLRRLAE